MSRVRRRRGPGLPEGAAGYADRMQTTLTATGPVAVDVAWERYADLDRWPQWAPQISGVDAPARRLEPGLRGTVRAAGVVHVAFEIVDVDEAARTWSWNVRLGPIRMHLEHGVEPAAPDARHPTRTWLRTTGPAPVVLPYAPLALIALHSLLLDR